MEGDTKLNYSVVLHRVLYPNMHTNGKKKKMAPATIHVHKHNEGVIPGLPVSAIQPVQFDDGREAEGEEVDSGNLLSGCGHLRCCVWC